MNNKIESFQSIINKESKILILGSMPGVESLRKQQYYANNRNQFWKILFSIFNIEPVSNYNDKKIFLYEYKIALWDVYKFCDREGSLDSNIRNGICNDFSDLLTTYPRIHTVLCNGGKAYKEFFNLRKKLNLNIQCIQLPSTSPAYTMKYSEKLFKWKSVFDELDLFKSI